MAWLRAWVPLVWAVLLLASPRAALPAGGDSVDAVVRAAIARGRLEYSRGGVAEAEQALAAAGAALTWADAMSHTALSVVVFAELAAVHMALREWVAARGRAGRAPWALTVGGGRRRTARTVHGWRWSARCRA